jgi:hypothetical protein
MDSLTPFTSLIRSLWRSRQKVGTATEFVARGSPVANTPAPRRDQEDLRERLRNRLLPLTSAAPERRCQAFVETVLLFELSESAGTDPLFADLVGKIVRELTVDERISARLEELFTEL